MSVGVIGAIAFIAMTSTANRHDADPRNHDHLNAQVCPYRVRGWARRGSKDWCAWASRSPLEPIKHVARIVKRHLTGIVNAVALRATNAVAASMNAKIQRVKKLVCRFRNIDRFVRAICFHLATLDLYPATSAHTKA